MTLFTRREVTRAFMSGVTLPVVAVMTARANAADDTIFSTRRMTPEKFAEYVRLFNAEDERYGLMYAVDVEFPHKSGRLLRGRQAIVEFYKDMHKTAKQTLIPGAVIIDNEHGLLAAEITVQVVPKPGTSNPTLKPGMQFVDKSVVIYTLNAEGKVSHIRGAEQNASCNQNMGPPPSGST